MREEEKIGKNYWWSGDGGMIWFDVFFFYGNYRWGFSSYVKRNDKVFKDLGL